ncbi:MAG TPA: 1,4-alpha-glucan branching enzyme [Lachnospiraceae bacterium]|nr:1,4-alpha-glucan branching enzyme [Lachnospiraceae bacterium]
MTNKLYKLMDWAGIEAIVYSEEDNPHRLLGIHNVKGGKLAQVFYPDATKAVLRVQERDYDMEMADEEGFFSVLIPKVTDISDYSFVITTSEGSIREFYDPYAFEPVITKKDCEKFNNGVHDKIYEILGSHKMTINGIHGVLFAVWAPGALRVSVVGDFNKWDGRIHQMRRLYDSGIFELFIPVANEGDCYKYEIKTKNGATFLKADPYAVYSQLRPETASIVHDLSDFKWTDSRYLSKRKKSDIHNTPINIYEVHLGSFARKKNDDFLNYKDLAKKIADYVLNMNYTHVELMPIMEHPYDASWGYQVTGYYAPTSRYGTPEDFKYFVDYMHSKGIGVILDWVPAHFPRDSHGLINFDGSSIYESPDPRKSYHPEWGTLIFDYGRNEVANFLLANCLYWIREYHADGIRMDAVSSMLYLDYGKNEGEWVANMYGGRENLEAAAFLKNLNTAVKKVDPSVMMIAEESTAWPLVTGDVAKDGLGFTFKWNMGWMNDFLDYMSCDPLFRAGRHGELTFSMIYAYSEKFILALSHDEVVHGKGSLIAKMPGDEAGKFANLRAAYALQMTHPGKKLLFMGQDLGDFDEFSEEKPVSFDLLKEDVHKELNDYCRDLNEFYLSNPALYELDESSDGFEWINSISANEDVLVFLRKTEDKNKFLLVVFNFSGVPRKDYKIGVPFPGKYKEVFNSDSKKYGGTDFTNKRAISSNEEECDEREDSIKIRSAAFSVNIFSYTPFTEKEKAEIEKNKEINRRKRIKEEAVNKALADENEARIKALNAREEADKADLVAKEALKKAMELSQKAQELEKILKKLENERKKLEESEPWAELL